MKSTLDQAGKLLELVSQSGRTYEWVQDHLIGSGAFSDLLGVDNLKDKDRDERRRFLGLPSFNPPLLEPIDTVTIQTIIEPLIVRDEYAVGVNSITYVGENFKQWFYPKVEAPAAAVILRYSRLIHSELDGPIIKELGGAVDTTLGYILTLIKRHNDGKRGVLLTNGYANIFYVHDGAGVLRAVHVNWDDDGWSVHANSVTNPPRWIGGSRVFSRNS